MEKRQIQLPDRIAFMADAHLGLPGDDPARIEKVASFIRWLNGKVSHLYILGDLFDFWIEYKSVIPNVAPQVVFELYNLIQSGTEVTIFAGNHDYWLGQYLRDSVGLNIVLNDMEVEHQGIKIYLHHGDGLFPDDYGYRILKKVLRSHFSIFLFKLLHPDIARRVAALTSYTSRAYLAPSVKSNEINIMHFRNVAETYLRDKYDAVIFGHIHEPYIERLIGGTFIIAGDWITHDSYVILENGEFNIHSWDETKRD